MAPPWWHTDAMKRLSLRLPDDLHQQATEAASADERSLNYLITAAVREFLQNRARHLSLAQEKP